MVTATPHRTSEQRLDALLLANDVRLKRATLKRELFAGGITVQAVLFTPPDYALGMKVATLLDSQYLWGPSKTRKMMRRLQISDVKTVGGLSYRQRGVLIEALA